ncbi:MAG: hypothetical protein ACRC0Y_03585 [Fusobacteriaceae bacterium]
MKRKCTRCERRTLDVESIQLTSTTIWDIIEILEFSGHELPLSYEHYMEHGIPVVSDSDSGGVLNVGDHLVFDEVNNEHYVISFDMFTRLFK